MAERLKAERQRVVKEEAKKASDALANEMTDLRQQLDDKAGKLDDAQKCAIEPHRLDYWVWSSHAYVGCGNASSAKTVILPHACAEECQSYRLSSRTYGTS